MTVVRDAISAKKQQEMDATRGAMFVPYDAVWCVCDVDQHPKIREAIKLAEQKGVKMAISNPSFEFWLVLHFEKFTTTGIQQREILSRLKPQIPGYEK